MLMTACGTAPPGPAASLASAPEVHRSIEVAVVPFGLAAGTSPPPYDVAKIIRADLETRGNLATVATADLPARPTRLREVDFATWRSSKADYLVVGLVAGAHDGGHEVEFRLLDPHKETTVVGYMMPSAPDALALTSHQIADLILEKLQPRAATGTSPIAHAASATGDAGSRNP
jgi:Tol biopolymer transport system component